MPQRDPTTSGTAGACQDSTAPWVRAHSVSLGSTALAGPSSIRALQTPCRRLAQQTRSSAFAAAATMASTTPRVHHALRVRGAGLESKTNAQPTPGRRQCRASSSIASAHTDTQALTEARALLARRATSSPCAAQGRARPAASGQAPRRPPLFRRLYARCATAVISTPMQDRQDAWRATLEPTRTHLDLSAAPRARQAAGRPPEQPRAFRALQGRSPMLLPPLVLEHASRARSGPGLFRDLLLATNVARARTGAGPCASRQPIKEVQRSFWTNPPAARRHT